MDFVISFQAGAGVMIGVFVGEGIAKGKSTGSGVGNALGKSMTAGVEKVFQAHFSGHDPDTTGRASGMQ